MRLQEVWHRLFEGRSIDFAGYTPRVKSEYGSESEYPAQQMSDGERVALYLAGRVVDSEPGVIIVDEPEVHFHSRLGSRFWNEMEQLRRDCLFVYVTHDLNFALSRASARFISILPNEEPRQIELEDGIPADLAESLLSAASLSIYARRVVFCEGQEGVSLDQRLYSAWFRERETAVVPVESCENVLRCAKTFGNEKLVGGMTSIGIVDRDYWPDLFIHSQGDNVWVLPVHEVENLFCHVGVLEAVGKHLGIDEATLQQKLDAFRRQVATTFSESLQRKEALERVKRRFEEHFRSKSRSLSPGHSLSELKSDATSALDTSRWSPTIEQLIDEEVSRISSAVDNGDFNILPGKIYLAKGASAIGVTKERLIELVCTALQSSSDEGTGRLGDALEAVLREFLPPRHQAGR